MSRRATNDERSRRRNDATSRAMKRLAANRTCKACNRGNAIVRKVSTDGVIVVRRCRWCGAERVFDMTA